MIKNILSNFIGRLWSILSNFLFIPLYIHYLGFESYSIISFTLVLAGLMAVLDVGLSATLSREFARVDNTKMEKLRIFITLKSSYYIIIGIIITLVIGLSETIANNWLNLDSLDSNRVSYFLKIISFDLGFQLLLRFYMGGLLGLEKQVKANIYQVSWGALRNGLVVVAIVVVPTLEMFFIWQAISTLIFAFLIGLSLQKELTGTYNAYFKFRIEKSVFKNIWHFAAGMFLITIISSMNTQIDKLTISKLLPIENLGYYTLTISLAMGIIVLVNPISMALLPRFTSLYSAGNKDEASKLFYKINILVVILVFTTMSTLSFFPRELIWIWTGKMELVEHTYKLIPIIALAYAMLALQIIPYNISIANGYTKIYNIIGVTSLFLTIPGYWIAVKHFGSIGAASVFCVGQILSTLIYLYFISKKFINTKMKSVLYVKQMLYPLLLSLIITFGFSFIPDWAKNSRIISLIWIATSEIFTFCIITLILLTKSEYLQIINYIPIFKKNNNV